MHFQNMIFFVNHFVHIEILQGLNIKLEGVHFSNIIQKWSHLIYIK